MKNSLILKFLAIFLCAASLLGIVGGAAGALTLVEGDLYHKSVEEVIAQRIQLLTAESANQIASRYADQILGGCPEEISRSYGNNLLSRMFTSYGYAILDHEGKTLESLNPELKRSADTYAFPITGQYMHLVSTETASQAKEAEARKQLDAYRNAMTDLDGQMVPQEGISVNQVIFTDRDGHVIYEARSDGFTGNSTYFYRDYLLDNGVVDTFSNSYPDHMGSHTGFLFYNVSGQLAYTSFLDEQEQDFTTTVYGVLFSNDRQDFTFQTENSEGLGILTNESGHLTFVSFAAKQESATTSAEEIVPVTTAETHPTETTAETEETQTEAATEVSAETTEEILETSAETSETSALEQEDVPSSASAEENTLPPETHQEVSQSAASAATPEDISTLAHKRMVFEWLLANNTIDPENLPEDLLPDEAFHTWLLEQKLIDPGQPLPEKNLQTDNVLPEVAAEIAEPVLINGKPLETYQVNRAQYTLPSSGELVTAKYVYLPMPELTVEIYTGAEALKDIASYDALRILRQYRSALLPVIGISLLLFALTAVYLCTAAGRNPHTEEVRAGGLNRMPLDLYLILGLSLGVGMIALAVSGTPTLLSSDLMLGCSLAVTTLFVCCLLFVGFFFAFVAQLKTENGFWWHNTLCVRVIRLTLNLANRLRLWLIETSLPWLSHLILTVLQMIRKLLARLYATVKTITGRIGAKLNRYFSLMPLMWQWVLAGTLMVILIFLTDGHFLSFAFGLGLIFYGSHCFGTLLESTRKMGSGNLDTKVDDRLMVGSFKEFAGDLNNLADVAMVAAQNQLKSERMKTELITNVSHDIKTPLTSIINYVDLLQKPHTEEDTVQYLEVLSRQSQRLKKLVEDLMDMSKASTGNMTVEITKVDAVESVNQALGEFSDKLERAYLYPVFRHTEESVPMMADGKLVWRILSNLLSNVVKYAMPGTRIYLDLSHVNGKVIISLKNISREELNINAEELMERFVRGDLSRNTEGSGLGLNIAKSLMELQGGSLQLLVDGDLFKVTLIFPDAR